MNPFILKAAFAFFISCLSFQGYLNADEIIISGNEHAVTVGDFDFSPCNTESRQGALAVLSEGSNGQISTGDLWKFFSKRGINSVENLTICMDWAPGQDRCGDIDVSSLHLKIEDPTREGSLLTNVSLGGHSLVVPGFEVSSFKPEAKLGVELGYDFMKAFGPESTEMIHLDFGETSKAGFLPTFSFEGSAGSPTRMPNLFGLFGFIGFWLIVFKCLTMATARKVVTPPTTIESPTTPATPGDIISA